MIDQSQFIKALEQIQIAKSNLYRNCGISLNEWGGVDASEFKEQKGRLLIWLKEEINPFFESPSNRDLAILSLAVKQEDQNDYIGLDQIGVANTFFKFEKKITFAEVQEFNSKFI